jgi:hypothetical protein
MPPPFTSYTQTAGLVKAADHPISYPRRPGNRLNWRKIAISNNVGGVKQYERTRLRALVEERHFALVVGLRFPT